MRIDQKEKDFGWPAGPLKHDYVQASPERAVQRETKNMIRDIVLRTLSAAIGAGLLFATASANAVPTSVNSLAAFNAAIGGASITTDTFSVAIPGGVMITFGSGVQSTLAGGDLSSAAIHNLVVPGQAQHFLDGSGAAAPLTLTYVFPFPVVGFGANYLGANFVDATILGTGTIFDLSTVMGSPAGFFGIADTMTPFTTVQFSVQPPDTIVDAFSLQNLRFAQAPSVLSVAEPATLGLFGVGLAALGLLARCRRRRQAGG